MERALEELVWQRAHRRCEYCQMPEAFDDLTFQIDHVIALSHGGPTQAPNLCLACFHCNSFKGPQSRGHRCEDQKGGPAVQPAPP